MDTTLNVLSLCSGGGLDLGLDIALSGGSADALGGVRTVCWVEWEAFALDFLASRMEAGCLHPAPVWTDLRQFDGLPWRGVVDCVTAGYPCQPFILAGDRRGADDPRHLWPHVRRIIGECQPGLVVLENVSGHLSLGADSVLAELEDLGYRVAASLFTAAEVGASHKRERLFIVGLRDDELADAGDGTIAQRAWDTGRSRRQRSPKWGVVGVAGDPVADAQHGQGRRQDAGSGPQGRTALASSGRATLRLVADGSSAGSQECACQRRDGGEELASAERSGDAIAHLPLFPPGPADLDQWERILQVAPWLRPATEPGVCGVVDGLAADRTKWLKLLGNGVVPLQAAYAITTLLARLAVGHVVADWQAAA